ncbi:hypothetical protein B0H12DRAFT_1121492 [Mycena haematopus]|nr:hypothetical protein B0H12DRAFT_1121492 [Mycena haematopus]
MPPTVRCLRLPHQRFSTPLSPICHWTSPPIRSLPCRPPSLLTCGPGCWYLQLAHRPDDAGVSLSRKRGVSACEPSARVGEDGGEYADEESWRRSSARRFWWYERSLCWRNNSEQVGTEEPVRDTSVR